MMTRQLSFFAILLILLSSQAFAATQECSYLAQPDPDDDVDSFLFTTDQAWNSGRIVVTAGDICAFQEAGDAVLVILEDPVTGVAREYRSQLPLSWYSDHLIPSIGEYRLSVRPDPDASSPNASYAGTYCVSVAAELQGSTEFVFDLTPEVDVEPFSSPAEIDVFPDRDGDGCGAKDEATRCADRESGIDYVLRGDDCNDANEHFCGSCTLMGFTECNEDNRYYLQCNPPITGVEEKWNKWNEQNLEYDPLYFSKNLFGYDNPYGLDPPPLSPGNAEGWAGGATNVSRHHIQSIQHMKSKGSSEGGGAGDFVLVSIAKTILEGGIQRARLDAARIDDLGAAGSVAAEHVVNTILGDHDHPGGMQAIGEYIFVAVEGKSKEPKHEPEAMIIRFNRDPDDPRFEFVGRQTIQTIDGHKYLAAAVGVTKLDYDWQRGYTPSYLMAFCSSSNCEHIQFLKSQGVALGPGVGYGDFKWVGEWKKSEVDYFLPWPGCGPQNIGLFVEKGAGPGEFEHHGRILVAMFGMTNPIGTINVPGTLFSDPFTISGCDGAIGSNKVYLYELESDFTVEPADIKLVYLTDITIQGMHVCKPSETSDISRGTDSRRVYYAFSTIFDVISDFNYTGGINFQAGGGLLIAPNGNDDIGFLGVEHYNSCGERFDILGFDPWLWPKNPIYLVREGSTRWGMTHNMLPQLNATGSGWPAVGVKEDLIATLEGAIPADEKEEKQIEQAIKHLGKSLDSALWEDPFTLTRKGKKMFDEQRKAVKAMLNLTAIEISAQVSAYVMAGRSLAQGALDDAVSYRGKPKYIDKAKREMNKALVELNEGKPEKAVKHHKKAWEYAQKALKKAD